MFERPHGSSASGGQSHDGWTVYRNVLALKGLGFSLDEMAQLTMSDFIALTDIAADPHAERPREATQEDIDRLLG